MKKTNGRFTLCLFLFSLAFFPAQSVAWSDSIKTEEGGKAQADSIEEVLVELKFPRESPFLNGHSLPEEQKSGWLRKLFPSSALDLTLPLASEQYAALPLADVEGTPITLGDMQRELLGDDAESGSPRTPGQPSEMLDRLITAHLFAKEGKAIGFDDLPQIREAREVFSRKLLRELLVNRVLEDVKPDPDMIEDLYEKEVMEYRLQGVSIIENEEAEKFLQRMNSGEDFEALVREYLEAKKAKGSPEAQWVGKEGLLPEIVEALGTLKEGEVSSIIPVGEESTILRLMGFRSPEDDPAALERAREKALNFAKNTRLVEYNRELSEKYVTIDEELLESVDFAESVEGFIALLEDDRVVARIEGEEPVTVGDIATRAKESFYHGIERQIENGSANEQKILRLNEILYKSIFIKEAMALGLHRSAEYEKKMQEFETSNLFNVFVTKILLPEIKLTADEVREYYDLHLEEFSSPGMLVIRGLVFSRLGNAEKAIEALRKGTDFRWLQTNSQGLVEDSPELMNFGNLPIMTKNFPPELQSVLADAEPGECRLYEDGKGHYYVLLIERVIPESLQPYEQVRNEISKLIFRKKFNETLESWGQKLREAYSVQVYAQGFHH